MSEVPTIEPQVQRHLIADVLTWCFRRWPLSRFGTNPVYRLPILVITKLLSLLTLFQIALICGLPWGHAAWGGQYAVLPMSLRLSSVFSIAVYALTLKIAVDRASNNQRRVYRKVTAFFVWLFTIYFGLGVIMNLLSGSAWEKYLMAPVALVLGLCYARLVPRPTMTDEMVHANS